MMTMGGSSDGGRRFRRSGGGGLMTEINVTPFVDVMLVLLIIFIVTTPMMQSGIDVNLPKEDAGSMEVKEENIVSLRADGAVFYNDKRYSLDELEEVLRGVKAAKPEVNVYLRADKDIVYGMVVEVMGTIRRAGVERLGMVTEIPSQDEKKKK